MNLDAKDIRCSEEINWFKSRMNQFVLQRENFKQHTHQIHNHTTDSQQHL